MFLGGLPTPVIEQFIALFAEMPQHEVFVCCSGSFRSEPEDAAVVEAALQRIEKAARRRAAYVAAYRDFDQFFDTVVRVKTKFQSFNSAITFGLLVDLAIERLEQLEAEEAESAGGPDVEATPS